MLHTYHASMCLSPVFISGARREPGGTGTASTINNPRSASTGIDVILLMTLTCCRVLPRTRSIRAPGTYLFLTRPPLSPLYAARDTPNDYCGTISFELFVGTLKPRSLLSVNTNYAACHSCYICRAAATTRRQSCAQKK